jgi:hypothetical protein
MHCDKVTDITKVIHADFDLRLVQRSWIIQSNVLRVVNASNHAVVWRSSRFVLKNSVRNALLGNDLHTSDSIGCEKLRWKFDAPVSQSGDRIAEGANILPGKLLSEAVLRNLMWGAGGAPSSEYKLKSQSKEELMAQAHR